MEDTLYSLNGTLVPADRAVIPVSDRGFLYGDGLFETLHAYGSKLFRMREHLQRLTNGASRLYFTDPPDTGILARWLQAVVRKASFQEANVRMTLTRGSGPRGPSIMGKFKSTVVITVTRFARPPESRFTHGVTAIMASFRRQEAAATAGLKTLNYIEQILAKREAEIAGADEALLLNNAGLLCEGSASNISIVRNGTLRIPDPERAGALPGIAQLTVLEAARSLKIPIAITSLSPWDLERCDEAFLTGSMRELTPLIKIDEKQIGGGRPGPLTKSLIARYRRIIERECKPYKYPHSPS